VLAGSRGLGWRGRPGGAEQQAGDASAAHPSSWSDGLTLLRRPASHDALGTWALVLPGSGEHRPEQGRRAAVLFCAVPGIRPAAQNHGSVVSGMNDRVRRAGWMVLLAGRQSGLDPVHPRHPHVIRISSGRWWASSIASGPSAHPPRARGPPSSSTRRRGVRGAVTRPPGRSPCGPGGRTPRGRVPGRHGSGRGPSAPWRSGAGRRGGSRLHGTPRH
jgi:hypothetical protein